MVWCIGLKLVFFVVAAWDAIGIELKLGIDGTSYEYLFLSSGVIVVSAGVEETSNWSNEQKENDLNDEAEILNSLWS